MATTTTKGSGAVDNDGGTIFGANNIAGDRFSQYSLITNNTRKVDASSLAFPGYSVTQAVKGGAVTITAITQSGSTGYINIEKSSHGLAVGDKLEVYGTNVTGYNRVHVVTVVTDSGNVKTNVKYSANTTTHGSYKLLSGTYGVLADFISVYVCSSLAGTATSRVRIPANGGVFRPVHISNGSRMYGISSWNAVTGAATFNGNRGSLNSFVKISDGTSLTAETMPNPRSVPGELTYTDGSSLPVNGTYNLRTQ